MFVEELRGFLMTEPVGVGADVATLSTRELDVLELVAAGLTNDAIAHQLFLSVRTVERHLANIYAKLRVSGKAGRTAAAVRYSEAVRARRHATTGRLGGGTDGGPDQTP